MDAAEQNSPAEGSKQQLIAIALHHRDNFSQGRNRKIFGYEAYHWAIFIMPEVSEGPDCQTFDVSDASTIDPVTFRFTNPTMDWIFRANLDADPELFDKLLGCLVIGEVTDKASKVELRDFFDTIPMPVKNTHPQQSCVTWAVNAIQAMQEKGWVRNTDLNQLKDAAISYADERMKGLDSAEPKVKYYDT